MAQHPHSCYTIMSVACRQESCQPHCEAAATSADNFRRSAAVSSLCCLTCQEEEDRLRDALDAQIERAQLATDHAAVDDASGAPVNQELIRADDDQPLRIALGPSAKPASHQLSRCARES